MTFSERSSPPDAGLSTATEAGSRAARLLEKVCRASANISALRFGIVGELADDLGRQLEMLARPGEESFTPDLSAEAALRCADLANLAACALPDLPPEHIARAAAAAHLAAGAARALCALAEPEARKLEGEHADNLLRDIRSAGWRAALAARQTDEFLEERRGD